jgi:hypothetical protein
MSSVGPTGTKGPPGMAVYLCQVCAKYYVPTFGTGIDEEKFLGYRFIDKAEVTALTLLGVWIAKGYVCRVCMSGGKDG